MVITRSASILRRDTNIEVNGDVAEASNKETMKNKRKTTAEVTEASEETRVKVEPSKETPKKVDTKNAQTSKKSKSGKKGITRLVETKPSVMDHAAEIFMREFLAEFWKNNPGEVPPDELVDEGLDKFAKLGRKKRAEYAKKYKDKEAEKWRRHKEIEEKRKGRL